MERFLVMLKFSCNIDYIPVSVDFIENYMPEANGAYVKVYLLALSLAVMKCPQAVLQVSLICLKAML